MKMKLRKIEFLSALALGLFTLYAGSFTIASATDELSGLTYNAYQNKDRNYDVLYLAPFSNAGTQWGNGADARYDQKNVAKD